MAQLKCGQPSVYDYNKDVKSGTVRTDFFNKIKTKALDRPHTKIMMDLKVLHSVLDQLEEERGIPREKMVEAIEDAMAVAYKKEYGKKGQIVTAHFDPETGSVDFEQIKIVVDNSLVWTEEEEEKETEEGDKKEKFSSERHIFLEDARKIKKDAELGEEIVFPLEKKDEYGRISAQTAKQVIIQKIREAEKVSVSEEFGQREGEIVSGTVQRIERGNIFIDLGRTTGILPYEEQIPGERYRQGERIRAYLQRVDETARGVFLRLSRSHPAFLEKLFEAESPEVSNKTVEIKAIAREAGSRSKIAVETHDDHIDPVGSLVGQRGVRVSTVMSELGGEKIDIIEWSDSPEIFIEESLSPAKVVSVEVDEEEKKATVVVTSDQQSLAIGKGGQNVRLAAKLTGWKIDILPYEDESAESEEEPDKEGGAVESETSTDDEAQTASEAETTETEPEDDSESVDESEKEENDEDSQDQPDNEDSADEEK